MKLNLSGDLSLAGSVTSKFSRNVTFFGFTIDSINLNGDYECNVTSLDGILTHRQAENGTFATQQFILWTGIM
ncbi:MAG TPA: hypothetical protein VN258_04250 [Mobilitalea sp.]|nr:hypothetical protein [Mobilitalea sp.]